MEFRVYFTFAQNEKIGCCYVRQPNVFIDAFSIRNPFHQLGPFKCNKTVLKSLYVLLGLSPVWNRYQRLVSRKGLPSVQYSRMMNL